MFVKLTLKSCLDYNFKRYHWSIVIYERSLFKSCDLFELIIYWILPKLIFAMFCFLLVQYFLCLYIFFLLFLFFIRICYLFLALPKKYLAFNLSNDLSMIFFVCFTQYLQNVLFAPRNTCKLFYLFSFSHNCGLVRKFLRKRKKEKNKLFIKILYRIS